MDLLEPSLKSKYDKCKYIVKVWEHKFKKKFGRIPSKLDIREADHKIKSAYKTYFNIKSALLEQSFRDVEGFNSDDDQSSLKESNFEKVSPTVNLNNVLQSSSFTEETYQNLDFFIEKEISTVENNHRKNIIEYTRDINDSNATEKTEDNITNPKLTENAREDINDLKTWGEHLNNRTETPNEKQLQNKSKVNDKFSKKLFSGSKFSKRNPRKSISFTQRKSESSISSVNFLSQPECTSSISLSENNQTSIFENTIYESMDAFKFKINLNDTKADQSQSTNFVKDALENNIKPLRTLDKGWIKRAIKNAGVETEKEKENLKDNFSFSYNLTSSKTDFKILSQASNTFEETNVSKFDYESEDVIEQSDEEQCFPINKRQKIEETKFENKEKSDSVKLDFSNLFRKINSTREFIPEKLCDKSNTLSEYNIKNLPENIVAKDKMKLKQNNRRNKVKNNSSTIRKSIRKNKNNFDVKNNKNTCESSNDDSDQESDIKDSAYGNEKETKIKRSKSKVLLEKNNLINSENSYELELSVIPKLKTVPRITKDEILLKVGKIEKKAVQKQGKTDCKNKSSNKKEIKLIDKANSGKVNENYVRINLKKKIYIKGRKQHSFSKYKKSQWKNKKKALNGQSSNISTNIGGKLTCFNCEKIGHFAAQCTEMKGDNLLPLDTEDSYSYPTLEEAANLAKDAKFVVRKPKITGSEENSENKCAGDIEDITQETQESTDNDTEEAESSCDDTDDVFKNDEFDEENILEEVLKLEEYASKLDEQQYIDNNTVVKPYYELNCNGTIIDTPEEVYETLRMFGHVAFRPGQEQAIMRILSGKSTLVTLSTGSGKSLCYQLPAYLYSRRSKCITLIISPLVSLMEDQISGIPHFLKAACLHTNQTKIQKEKVMEAISSNNLDILLISPEAVVGGEKSSNFNSIFKKLPPIAFACIDEAHCVSQWSHNFRPSYLMICRILHECLGINTILGLTATATRTTSDSIIKHLQIPDGRLGIISDVPLPDNLKLSVSRDANKDSALLSLILSEEFSSFKSIIVYCIRRQECDRIASYLRTSLRYEKVFIENHKKRKRTNAIAEAYHAGLSASKRKSVQKTFMSGNLKIVVATVAFGMGINKSDIRAVIHYNMPKNFESYVQEIGRAGRDGLLAHCHLFLDSQGNDENELKRHIYSNSVDRHTIRKLLQKIFVPCSCKSLCPKHEVAFSIQDTVQALDLPEEIISTLLCYLELHGKRFIKVLNPVYVNCKVISYGGSLEIRKAAKNCPPLAMALVLHKGDDENILQFPVVDIASTIGWESSICKLKLKNLEWISVNNVPKRSLLSVQFSNLGFHLLAPGNLTETQLDEVLNDLYNQVLEQEKTALMQLRFLHSTLMSAAVPSYKNCIGTDVSEKEKNLKIKLREYFENPNPSDLVADITPKITNEEQIANDVRALVLGYKDNTFTGRTVARIFYGIPSPNFPAFTWCRCKFWRSHLCDDFNLICKIATREILKLRL